MSNTSLVPVSHTNNLIRTMVRGAYDLQKIRIQMGNRITGNFKAKLGMTPDGMSETDLAKQEKRVLDLLRKSYTRLTDGVVAESGVVDGKLPTAKKFVGDELISSYVELVLVDQYMTLLRDEERHFHKLTSVLTGIPIYDRFLSEVRGIGPAMAGILISEINIHAAEYPSSLWKYAGLDAVTVGTYTDNAGKVHTVPSWKIDAHYDRTDDAYLAEGIYPVTFTSVGRSRKEACLVKRTYINKAGQEAERDSITYNPFLKTKLIGVLGTSFLRAISATVDGVKMGGTKRLELAKSLGYTGDQDDIEGADPVTTFLRNKGHTVVIDKGRFGSVYYDYKSRLENDPRHKEKTPGHRHNMAIRYMIKRFLVALYNEWRACEGLVVAPEYSEAKLGMIHKQA